MLSCSFCNKSQDKVSKLIIGKDVAICNECVLVSVRILLFPDILEFKKRLEAMEKKLEGKKEESNVL